MGKIIALFMLVFLILTPIVTLFVLSSHTSLAFAPQTHDIGVSTWVAVKVANPHGTRDLTAWIEQNGMKKTLMETKTPADRLKFWLAQVPDQEVHFMAGSKEAPSLKEGPAKLVVEAKSNDFRGATDTISTDVNVILRPPSVSADGFQHYINQGGSEMVLITPTGSWSEAGVRVAKDRYRSFPIAGRTDRLVLFAYPWDTPLDTAPVVFAKNSAGTEAQARFWYKIFPKKFRKRDLEIDDKFLDKVVNQIDPGGQGNLVDRFLKINGDMRRANNKTLADLKFKTADKFLWTDSFLQLSNSKVESEFADVRSYIYKGKKIDQQVHLGFDLAVTAHTPVLASNDGRVVWAAPLGIYGNCIVVDHGYGLQSIYGHLSSLAVKEGDMVKRGQEMGKSGSTGLAGGDHLHYSMQVEGVEVNPVEWWDAHWIKDHVQDRLKGQ
ncbi:MAG TPA: peptidoglycan DD-metalloendopeptidase family protein [Bryobacteraceae bacterium]|nr:peptidoglycan DD-metalloendopeptidase family protein [Bryobacteraceae bacterium]